MNGPDFLSTTEEKELSHLIELQIDTAIEEKHLHEVEVLEGDNECDAT